MFTIGATPPAYIWSDWTEWATCCYEDGYDSRYTETKQGQKVRHRDCRYGNCPGKGSEREVVKDCTSSNGNGDSGGYKFCAGMLIWSTV